jgi:hypothetical protein
MFSVFSTLINCFEKTIYGVELPFSTHRRQYQCLDTPPLSAPGPLLQPWKKIQHILRLTIRYQIQNHRWNYIKKKCSTIKIIVIERCKAYYMSICQTMWNTGNRLFGDWAEAHSGEISLHHSFTSIKRTWIPKLT